MKLKGEKRIWKKKVESLGDWKHDPDSRFRLKGKRNSNFKRSNQMWEEEEEDGRGGPKRRSGGKLIVYIVIVVCLLVDGPGSWSGLRGTKGARDWVEERKGKRKDGKKGELGEEERGEERMGEGRKAKRWQEWRSEERGKRIQGVGGGRIGRVKSFSK